MAIIDKKTFTIRIGNDFYKLLQITLDGTNPIDLTDYSFKMQIRGCKSDPNVIQELVSPSTIDISDAENGNIILTLSGAVTSALEERNAVYDLQWTTNLGKVETILEGNIKILETVTK